MKIPKKVLSLTLADLIKTMRLKDTEIMILRIKGKKTEIEFYTKSLEVKDLQI